MFQRKIKSENLQQAITQTKKAMMALDNSPESNEFELFLLSIEQKL